MNRIVIALIIFTLLLPLAACKDPAPDSSMPVFVIRTTTTTEPTAETTWPADPWPVDPWPTDPPKPVRPDSTPFPLPESIGDSRPAPLPDFNPACNVLPLLSQPSVYGMHVMGQLNFIDRQYNLIPVPEQAEMYYTPYEFNGEDYLPQAYCLYDNDQKMAVMDLSGNLLTGFEYDYYSTYEGPDLGNFKGYLIVCKKQNPGTDNEQPFFGVLDLKTGKEVLPPVYNYLYLMDGYIYTEKDGEMNIFDYAGKRLVGPEKAAPDFLAPKPESPHFNSAEAPYRMSYSSFRDTMYYGELGQYMLVWGTGKPNEMPKVSVYDRSKTHLLTIDFKDFYYDGEYVFILGNSNAITYIFSENTYTIFNADPGGFYYDFLYKDDTITYRTYSDSKGWLITVDADGNRLAKVEDEKNDSPGGWNPEFYDINVGELTLRQQRNLKSAVLLDKNGKTIFETNVISCFQIGPFIAVNDLVVDDEGRYNYESTAHIFSLTGKLLLENVYGYIPKSFPGEDLVVYKSATECGILKPDGSYQKINAPEVTCRYNACM